MGFQSQQKPILIGVTENETIYVFPFLYGNWTTQVQWKQWNEQYRHY